MASVVGCNHVDPAIVGWTNHVATSAVEHVWHLNLTRRVILISSAKLVGMSSVRKTNTAATLVVTNALLRVDPVSIFCAIQTLKVMMGLCFEEVHFLNLRMTILSLQWEKR